MEKLVRSTIKKIEDDLGKALDLEVLSTQMGYSKYHFHRLFLNEVGESAVSFIRRRRVIRSTYELLSSDRQVTDIAYGLGFSNVDTYIRAFKNYFDMTPSHYRKRLQTNKTTTKKECIRMKDYLVQLRACTKEEKHTGFIMLEEMTKLSRHAHKNGLLSIESVVNERRHKFLNKAIELLLAGIEPNVLKDVLLTYISTTRLSNAELLTHVLIMEGVLMIQEGAYPWEMKTRLSAFFGIDSLSEMGTDDRRKNHDEALNNFLETGVSHSSQFENEFKNISLRSMQRLLRECDLILITMAFLYSSMKLKELVTKSLPKGRLDDLLEAIDHIGSVNESQRKDAQNHILGIYKRLRVSGDVI